MGAAFVSLEGELEGQKNLKCAGTAYTPGVPLILKPQQFDHQPKA